MRRETNLLSDKNTGLYLPVLGLLFLLSIVVKKEHDVIWINGHHTDFTDQFFRMITHLGDGLLFIPLTIILVFVRFQYAIMCAIIALLHGLIVSLFKRVLFPGALRPKGILDNDLLHFVPGVDVHTAHSFPSGHTATIFCAALFIALVWRNKFLTIVFLIMALLVAYSRIYLLQHFLIDVAAGAVIGSFTTLITWHLFERINKPGWMNSRLEVKFSMAPFKKTMHMGQEKTA